MFNQWLGRYVDTLGAPCIDWRQVASVLEVAYRIVAPARLVKEPDSRCAAPSCRSQSSREVRLYIDPTFDVFVPQVPVHDEPLRCLLVVNSLLVVAVGDEPNGLEINFDDGSRLHVSEESESCTTGDIWWLSPWLR